MLVMFNVIYHSPLWDLVEMPWRWCAGAFQVMVEKSAAMAYNMFNKRAIGQLLPGRRQIRTQK